MHTGGESVRNVGWYGTYAYLVLLADVAALHIVTRELNLVSEEGAVTIDMVDTYPSRRRCSQQSPLTANSTTHN